MLPGARCSADLRPFENSRLRKELSVAFGIFVTKSLSLIAINDLRIPGIAQSCNLLNFIKAFFTMTTYTRAASGEQPAIYTSPEHIISRIDPLIYGGFTEYVVVFGRPT
jgi:hypothetical protein